MGDFGGGYTGSMDNTDSGWNEQGGRRGYTYVGEHQGEDRFRDRERDNSQDGGQGYYNIGGDRGAMEYGGNTGFGYTRAGQSYEPSTLGSNNRGDYRDSQNVNDYHDVESRGYASGGLYSPSPEARRARGGNGPADQTRDEYGNPVGHFRDPADPRFDNQERRGEFEQGRQSGGGKSSGKKGGLVEKAMHVVDDLI